MKRRSAHFRMYSVMIIVLIVTITSVLLTVNAVNKSNDDYRTIAHLNGEPVALGEFKLFFLEIRPIVIGYYQEKHKTVLNSDSWNKSFNGEIPMEMAINKTFEKIKRIKIEQKLFKENGIANEISYAAFRKQLKNENKKRMEMLGKNQVIHGVQQFNENNYYNYQYNNGVTALREKYKNKMDLSEAQLIAFYQSNKEEWFKETDYIQVLMIKADKSHINKAKSMLDKGEDFETVMKLINKEGKSLDRIFDMSTIKYDTLGDPKVYDTVKKLKIDEISEIVESVDGFIILKCVEKRENQFQTFEKSKNHVINKYIEQEYNHDIDRLVEQAQWDVSINPKDLAKDLNIYNN